MAEVVTLARDPTGATEQAARDAAGAAAAAAGVVVEEVDPERVPQVEHLANTVWGRRTGLSRDIVSALEIAGGVMLLAYPVGDAGPGGDPCGFTLGFFGVRGGIHLHSHMTAVLPRFTSHGVGYAIKLAQRAACLDRGVTEVQWTFDPLLARNARFNLSRLGAGARWFRRDVYGVGHDRISGADRTDRLGVTWPLSAERTRLAIAGRAPTAPGDSAAAGAPGPLILHSRECAGGPEPEIGESGQVTPSAARCRRGAPPRLCGAPAPRPGVGAAVAGGVRRGAGALLRRRSRRGGAHGHRGLRVHRT